MTPSLSDVLLRACSCRNVLGHLFLLGASCSTASPHDIEMDAKGSSAAPGQGQLQPGWRLRRRDG